RSVSRRVSLSAIFPCPPATATRKAIASLPREPAQQPCCDPTQGPVAVAVARVVLGEDRHGHALSPVLEPRDLVVHPAGPSAPAALEVQTPRPHVDAADPPALPADDVAEQAPGEAPVP